MFSNRRVMLKGGYGYIVWHSCLFSVDKTLRDAINQFGDQEKSFLIKLELIDKPEIFKSYKWQLSRKLTTL
jgi:hypothetical protein